MRVLKRVLTRKSILGFGYSSIRDLSVQMIIDIGQERQLVSAYFGLEKIDFTEDILDELKIEKDMRLVKPSKVENLKETMEEYTRRMREGRTGLDAVKALSSFEKKKRLHATRKRCSENKFGSAAYLTRKNQGH